MFTGIISKTSKVQNFERTKGGLSVSVLNNLEKVRMGESINVNGVCSTARKAGNSISFEYMPETIRLTTVGILKKGDIVNVEQSMKAGDRMSGHIVLGHIDGRGTISSIQTEGNSKIFEIKLPRKKFKKFLVYKGSVAVEGISLSVAKVLSNSFIVKIIPYTLKHTNLKEKRKGDMVNVEFDIFTKYASQK
ncbi:riboflavin synthase [Candidatus Nomurabacteria bacterium]|nr:riboflavin synthase [Candidatus Nomurabacteria bacterium]